MADRLRIESDTETGRVTAVTLYGEPLLAPDPEGQTDLWVNGHRLATYPYSAPGPDRRTEGGVRLKGEWFVDHYSGWGLVVNRSIGGREGMAFNCVGINYQIRRELAEGRLLPCPGPGGPVNEAPLHVDRFGLLNWNWRFWGEQTRMLFPSSHSQGPADEFGHIGYEHDTPERCKRFMQNAWRRTYPGSMVVHGGVFYNAGTGHWLAITCRRAHVGYRLNIDDAGAGVGYDFLLHAPFGIGDVLRMPEIKLYYGRDRESMMAWLGWYATFYYEEAPDWVFKKLWGPGLAWDARPTWTEQADYWEAQLDKGHYNAIGYSLVTNRPVHSGTTPLGYEPDPNHGTIAEFKAMCHRLRARGVPLLIWMSHSGIAPGAPDVDDDWFIRGIDGRWTAGWGSEDSGMVMCNPGHPGYLAYTKQWIDFYIRECGCKGIFFDCLGWVFPPDFRPRSFMRYPADTNLLSIRFQTEMYAAIKACDPEAIMLGEGCSLDGPLNVFAIAGNPVRAIDGMGPRDFFLNLNTYAPKRMVLDQGGLLFPAQGMCKTIPGVISDEHNDFVRRLLEAKGASRAAVPLPGDVSILDGRLFVAWPEAPPPNTACSPPRDAFALPPPWAHVDTLRELFGDRIIRRDARGEFRNVAPGIYELHG